MDDALLERDEIALGAVAGMREKRSGYEAQLAKAQGALDAL